MNKMNKDFEAMFDQKAPHGLVADGISSRRNGKTVLGVQVRCDVHNTWHRKGEVTAECNLGNHLRETAAWMDEAGKL